MTPVLSAAKLDALWSCLRNHGVRTTATRRLVQRTRFLNTHFPGVRFRIVVKRSLFCTTLSLQTPGIILMEFRVFLPAAC